MSILLPNASRIVGLPGKDSYIRGFSNVSLMLIDEAARVPNELYLAVRPMLAVSNGGLWLMSTPNGKSGFFYDTWVSDDPSWTRISIPATECPRISPANLESDRALMPAFFFRQEYLCEFHDSDAQFMSSQSVHQAIQPGILPISFQPGQYPYIEPPPPALLPPGSLPDAFLDRRFYIGIDLGVIRDHTAFAVLERSRWATGPKSPIDFSRTKETRLHVRHLERLPLGKGYGHSADVCREILRHPDINPEYRVAVDATGVGQPFKTLLQERGISSYIRWISITNGGKASPCGDNMTVPRLELLNGLCVQFEEGRLRISDQLPLAQALAQELLSLKVRVTEAGRQATGSLSGWRHDDLVFALALASYLATTERY